MKVRAGLQVGSKKAQTEVTDDYAARPKGTRDNFKEYYVVARNLQLSIAQARLAEAKEKRGTASEGERMQRALEDFLAFPDPIDYQTQKERWKYREKKVGDQLIVLAEEKKDEE